MKRQMRRTFGCLALVWASTTTVPCQAADSPLTVGQAVETAIAGNPNLAQMRARYDALAELPAQMGVLPDPVLSVNALNFPTDTFEYRQEPMTQVQIGISQRFPFPGKLALAEQATQLDANAAFNFFEEAHLTLVRDVRSTWWTVHYVDRALEIVDQNQQLLRQFIEIATARYEVGDGLQQDVLLAQVELSRLLDRRIRLISTRQNQEARLLKLMDRPAGDTVSLPKEPGGAPPEPDDDASLITRAEERRPLLAQLRNQIAAAESRLELARKDYYPDFTVAAAYGFRGGDNPPTVGGSRSDFLSVRLSVNLPVYPNRKRGSAVSQKTSELLGQRYALQDALGAVHAEITRANADYVQARDQMSLFANGIIPQARQTVQSMLAAYQVNQVDFLNLIRSQITLFDYELEYWRALSAVHQAYARLDAATGAEVTNEQ